MSQPLNHETDQSVWGVSPAIFRSMVAIHCNVKFLRDVGPLSREELDYVTERLMDGYYSFNFTDILEDQGVEKINDRIRELVKTHKTLGENK